MILKYETSNLLGAATLITGVFFGFHSLGWAGGYYTCPSPAVLSSDASSCSDGSIPVFHADPVCSTSQVLQNHVCVTPASTDHSENAERIFNWAEQAYPEYFPAHEITKTDDPWIYRYYQATNTYLGINNQDSNVYVLGDAFGPTVHRVDTVENVLNMANADPASLFGVWKTSIPGTVSSSGTVNYGLAVGDLVIRPDGTYTWNSYGGKSGSWTHGDSDYPVVLIDTVENKQWKVGADPKHLAGRDIIIWDGNSLYYDGRK